jgi:ABC-type polysaccharide/polyol phosphate export permease
MMTGAGPAVAISESSPPHWGKDLLEGIRETWRARDLIHQLTVRDIRVRYKEAVMGVAWAIVMPVLIILSGLIIRTAMSKAMGGAINREVVLSLGTKGLAWGLFSGAVGFGTTSLTASSHLISKVYFPRAALPISATLTQCFDTGIAMLAFTLMLPFLGAQVSGALLWAPVLLALLVAFTLAAILFLSCANVFFRDVKYIVQVMLTFGIFFTPVFYDPSMLGPVGARLIMLNPLAPILEGLVLTLSRGHNLLEPLVVMKDQLPVAVWMPGDLWYSVAWAIGGLVVSAALFRRGESHFADFV